MLKNCNKKNKKSKNNKGFTLVELVVVIAILAILVGLLVPQYTKYVDKARKSSDASNLANMVRAVEIKAADPNGKLAAGVIKIVINGSSTTAKAYKAADDSKDVPDQTTVVQGAIKETMGNNVLTETKLKSTSWTGNSISATITIGTDYSFTTEYSKGVSEYISGAKEPTKTSGGNQP